METGTELFIHDLRDIYDAESKLVNALQTMANKVENPQLKEAFVEHQKVTQALDSHRYRSHPKECRDDIPPRIGYLAKSFIQDISASGLSPYLIEGDIPSSTEALPTSPEAPKPGASAAALRDRE